MRCGLKERATRILKLEGIVAVRLINPGKASLSASGYARQENSEGAIREALQIAAHYPLGVANRRRTLRKRSARLPTVTYARYY